MSQVRLVNIDKVFGADKVLDQINIEIADREFMAFVGPSGCGKTTLMRTIAGLEKPSAGRVFIGEDDVTHANPSQRGVAMVFQSYALYPHMTVYDNIAFGLKLTKAPKEEIDRAVRDAAGILQIDHVLDRKPAALSGGQRQRVAIGRSIVRNPKVFLFDEPLSNLDATMRVQMRVELISLRKRLNATMVYVTHDQVEAMTMADRIVVLNKGRVEQVGTPLDLYRRPQNLFVAGFIGSPKMNFLKVGVTDVGEAGVTVTLPSDVSIRIPVQGKGVSTGDQLTLGVRPEHLGIGDAVDGPADAHLKSKVRVVEHLGGEIFVHSRLAEGTDLELKTVGHDEVDSDDQLDVGLRASLCHLFGEDGQALPALRKQRDAVTA